MTLHILLIENNSLAQSESLLPHLEEHGYQICVAYEPSVAVQKIQAIWPDLIMFNSRNLEPGFITYHKAISDTKLNVPYLVVGEQNDLPAQTDTDIIVTAANKPKKFSRAVNEATLKQADRFIRLPNLTVDCEQSQVLRNGQSYNLTPKEFKLLHLLVSNADQITSRKAIMQEVWETDYLGDTRTLDVHIRWLREKIEENPSRPRHLITVRGVGYHFIAEPDKPSA
jgi:DNA-binding response OmpR family regulator